MHSLPGCQYPDQQQCAPIQRAARHTYPAPLYRSAALCRGRLNTRDLSANTHSRVCPQKSALLKRRSRTTTMSAAGSAAGDLRVGFVGLGIMGTPMALNLVKAGYDLTVWNRSAGKAQTLTDAGAKVASTPTEVAERCDVIVGMLADPAAARSVATEVAKGLGPGKGYVDMSTIDAQSAQSIRDEVVGTGAVHLEAPVSGSKQPAEQGTLVILAAGDKGLYERASPLFDVMGKAKFYLGEVGQGANMKIAVNMLMGSMLASYAEALSLAEAAGLNAADFVDVVNTGALAAPIFGMKGKAMAEGKYPPAFPLRHQKKDLGLAEALAQKTSQPLSVAKTVHKLYTQAAEQGLADEDFTAILEVVGRLKR